MSHTTSKMKQSHASFGASPFSVDATAFGRRQTIRRRRLHRTRQEELRRMPIPHLADVLNLEKEDWAGGDSYSRSNRAAWGESKCIEPQSFGGSARALPPAVSPMREYSCSDNLGRSQPLPRARSAAQVEAGVAYASVTEELRIALAARGIDEDVGMKVAEMGANHHFPGQVRGKLPSLPATARANREGVHGDSPASLRSRSKAARTSGSTAWRQVIGTRPSGWHDEPRDMQADEHSEL